MRYVPPALQADLDAGVQTLCVLLQVHALDDSRYGYADLDIDVEYDDGEGGGVLTYSAQRGVMPSDIVAKAGLGVDNAEATSLIPQFEMELTPQALAAGKLDDADFRVLLVNYKALEPGRHVELQVGKVGRVWVVDGAKCIIELRSLSSIMRERTVCERDSLTCRVKRFGSQAGEERYPCCYDTTGMWQAIEVDAIDAEPDRKFTTESEIVQQFTNGPGMFRWLTGDNAGREADVEAIEQDGGTTTITFVQPLPFDVQPGDTGEYREDCDRSWEACGERENRPWFRGEPKIKTSDAAAAGMPGAQTSQGAGGVDTTPIAAEFQQ